jgi:SAM-dependent methyltransferase
VSTAVPPRIVWAVELLDPRADDVVLEVGCGPGVAAELVCRRVVAGRVVAVDRSPVAVERTARRNAGALADGRLQVVRSSLAELQLPRGSVDRAFCVDVNLFWTGDAAADLTVLRDVLRPGGHLFVLYGHGPTGADRVCATVEAALRRHGFDGVTTVSSAAGSGVRARAPRGAQRPSAASPRSPAT